MSDEVPVFIPCVFTPEQARALVGAANVISETAPLLVRNSPEYMSLIGAALEISRKYDKAMKPQ